MTDIIRNQILQIRDSGITNLFDLETVCYYAFKWGLRELSEFLNNNKREYLLFILTGKETD